MNWHILLAVLLAAVLPLSLLVTGVELRRVRLRIVEDLEKTIFKDDRDLPQLVLAKARYSASSDMSSRVYRQDEVKQWVGAAIYILVSSLGFVLLFDPVSYLIGDAKGALTVWKAIFWLPQPGADEAANLIKLHHGAAIAGFGFLGGYSFNLSYLIRQTLNQELSALAFVRAALRLIQGVILAAVVYHGGATLLPEMGAALGDAEFAVGLAVAFTIGYFPDAGRARIARVARIRVKEVDQLALEKAKIVPLEVIDGIDHEVSFRLQESNLFDVQNLAVANPIQLSAETPYGLLQIFDWILQAQLCLVTGTSAFFELKRHRIRTIFDLERATLAIGVPDEYLRAIACVLLADSSACMRTAIGISGEYEKCPAPDTARAEVIRHIAAIMSDDVHVHRLRKLWQAILRTTAGVSTEGRPLWLFETGWLPGEPPKPA